MRERERETRIEKHIKERESKTARVYRGSSGSELSGSSERAQNKNAHRSCLLAKLDGALFESFDVSIGVN